MTKLGHCFALSVSAALLAMAQGGLAHAQGSLGFTNGSFESGVTGPTSPFTSSTGWNLWLGPASSGSNYGVDMSSTAPRIAEDGSFYAFFHATSNITDCIGEELSTVPGQRYTVRFWLATDGPTNAQSSQMQVVWGPDFGTSSRDTMVIAYQDTSLAPLVYRQVTQTFTAVTNHDILAFHGYDATSDILIDNVTVTPVSVANAPALGPWLSLLLGALMTGIALGVLRKTQNARTACALGARNGAVVPHVHGWAIR